MLFQEKVLEPLGAITSGSQFLEPDGTVLSWKLFFVFLFWVYILTILMICDYWDKVCFQIIFPTLRIRPQWKLLPRQFLTTRPTWGSSLIQMLIGNRFTTYIFILYLFRFFIFTSLISISLKVCCCGFHWSWVKPKSSDCFNVCYCSWGSKIFPKSTFSMPLYR